MILIASWADVPAGEDVAKRARGAHIPACDAVVATLLIVGAVLAAQSRVAARALFFRSCVHTAVKLHSSGRGDTDRTPYFVSNGFWRVCVRADVYGWRAWSRAWQRGAPNAASSVQEVLLKAQAQR